MCVIVFSQASTSVQQGALLVRERQRGRLILLIENTLFLARPWLAWFQVTKPFANENPMLERASDITFSFMNTPRRTNHVYPWKPERFNYFAYTFCMIVQLASPQHRTLYALLNWFSILHLKSSRVSQYIRSISLLEKKEIDRRTRLVDRTREKCFLVIEHRLIELPTYLLFVLPLLHEINRKRVHKYLVCSRVTRNSE